MAERRDHLGNPMYYVLRDGKVVAAKDALEWGEFFEDADARRVALTEIGNVQVSTVFLGIDHNFSGKGAPLLWETAVFGFEDCDIFGRWASEEAARDGHAAAVLMVKARLAELRGPRKRAGRKRG
jgi:hypothetical protein